MTNKIKINAFFNVLYQFMMILFPFISSAYVARVLLADGIGKISFIQNIVSYFVVLVALGIPNYGTREIAKTECKADRNALFTSLFIINFISTVVVSTIFVVIISEIPSFSKDFDLYMVCGLQLLFNIGNVDWFFQGIEDYRLIALRSIFIRAISLFFIFYFVKSKDDLVIYLLINSFVIGANSFWNLIKLRRNFIFEYRKLYFFKHLKSIFALLATIITIELYTKIDTTFIGIMIDETQVGLYAYSSKIVLIIVSIISAFCAVFMPHMSRLYNNNQIKELTSLMSDVILIVLIFALPLSMGIFILSEDILVLLFGNSFACGSILLKCLSPLITIMSLGALIGTHCLIALEKEKSKFYATLIAAILNIVFTPFLINYYGSMGACVASVISEATVLVIYIIIVKRRMKILVKVKDVLCVLGSTLIMSFFLTLIKRNLSLNIFNIILLTMLSSMIYFFAIYNGSKKIRTLILSLASKYCSKDI